MKKQKQIAEAANIASQTLSNILTGRRRPSWPVAKRLAEVTCTRPELWLDGTPEQIRAAIQAVETTCPEKNQNQGDCHGPMCALL